MRIETEARELEVQRTRQLKAVQLRELRMARRMVTGIFRDAVLAANRGDKELCVPYPPDGHSALETELDAAGFNFVQTHTRGVEARIESRLQAFFSVVDESPLVAPYLSRALRALQVTPQDPKQQEEWTAAAVLDVLAEWEVEGEELINEQARDYLDNSLYPFLHNLPLVEPTKMLRLTWQPADLTQEVVTLRGQVPSWMCSTSGNWLLQRVSECASKAADGGLHDAIFEFVPVPRNEERWGGNSMSKLVHRGQPLGVTPFAAELMGSLFKALGFDTERMSLNGLQALRLTW